MTEQRIPPLPKEEWTDEAREVFAFWGEPGAWENGSKLMKEMVMARHPRLAMAFNTFGRHVLLDNTVPERPRQLAILRAAWLLKSEYFWHFHVGFSLNAGLTLDEIAAVRNGLEDLFWTGKPNDIAAMQAVEELFAQNSISAETWQQLAGFLQTRELMDFVFTIGSYITLAWAMNSFGITLGDEVDKVGFDLKTQSGNDPRSCIRPGETDDWSQTGAG